LKPQLLAAGGTPPALLAVLAWSKSHTIKNPAAFRHRGPLRGPKAYHPRRGDRGQKKKREPPHFHCSGDAQKASLAKDKKIDGFNHYCRLPFATVYHCHRLPFTAVYPLPPSTLGRRLPFSAIEGLGFRRSEPKAAPALCFSELPPPQPPRTHALTHTHACTLTHTRTHTLTHSRTLA
jgi:hypothetical protein